MSSEGQQSNNESTSDGGDQQHLTADGRRENIKKKKKADVGVFDIWALGIAIVIGGQYFCWNAGLVAGFGSYAIATILVGTAYICLCLSMGEVTSVLPFAGGAYGFTRLAFGLYPGFMIGACESVEYMVYVASSAYTLCQMIAGMTGSPPELVPVYCLAFYISALVLQIAGGSLFWRSTAVMAVVSFLVVLMYGFGSIKFADLQQYGPSPLTTGSDGEYGWFLGGMPMFMRVMPLSAWFYVGVESLNLANCYPLEPRTTIPRGSVLCILTLFATSMLVLFVCSGLPPLPSAYIPGDDVSATASLAVDLNPLNKGFIMMFSTPGGPVLSQSMATLLSIPATYATAFGFIFSYGRVIYSMSRSKLLPQFLSLSHGPEEIPYAAQIAGSVFGYALCLLVYFVPYVGTLLFNQCILAGFMAYICQCGAYVWFKIYHRDMPRLFNSPLGIFGAVYGGLVFSVATIAALFFQNDNYLALYIFISTLAIYTLYYYGYARSRQQFSPDEKFIFVTQIVKFNERARRRAMKGRQKLNKTKMMDLPIFAHVGALLNKAVDSSGRILSKGSGTSSVRNIDQSQSERRSSAISSAAVDRYDDDERSSVSFKTVAKSAGGGGGGGGGGSSASSAKMRAYKVPWNYNNNNSAATSASQKGLLGNQERRMSSSMSSSFLATTSAVSLMLNTARRGTVQILPVAGADDGDGRRE